MNRLWQRTSWLLSGIFLSLCINSHTAWAAVQGTPGSTSQGSTQLHINVTGQVRITGLQDMQLGTFSGSNHLSNTQTLCLYSNDPNGDYTVTLTTTAGNFILQGPGVGQTTHSVPFEVFWSDNPHGGAETQAQYNTVLTQTGGRTIDDQCMGATANASIRIAVQSRDLAPVLSGLYHTTLILTVGQT